MDCYPIGVPLLHGLIPSECPLTWTDPIGVPPYMHCSHRSAPLHGLFPSECPFTWTVP
ncbi:unnamed protein product, partial [Staurois parvus]